MFTEELNMIFLIMSAENLGNENGLSIVFDISKNEEGTP